MLELTRVSPRRSVFHAVSSHSTTPAGSPKHTAYKAGGRGTGGGSQPDGVEKVPSYS